MLPELVKTSLIEHLKCVRRIHQLDIKEGFGQVNMPFALSRKYPNASREYGTRTSRSQEKLSGIFYVALIISV